MDKKAVIEIVERFRRKIEEQGITPQKVILYGSHTTGKPAPESDIDVVVISEDFGGKSFWERVDVLSEAIYDLSAPLEAIAMTPDEWNRGESLVIDFAKNGEVLYPA